MAFQAGSAVYYHPQHRIPPHVLLSDLDHHLFVPMQAPASAISTPAPPPPPAQPPPSSAFTFKFAPQMSMRTKAQRQPPPSTSRPSTPTSPAFSSFQRQSYDSDGYDSFDDDTKSYTNGRGNVRPTGACAHCKSLKVKCQFDKGESSCQRCLAGKHECVVRGRKKRKPAPTHEALVQKSLRQDATIQSILAKLDQIKTEKKVKDWIDKAHEETSSSGSPNDSPSSTYLDHSVVSPYDRRPNDIRMPKREFGSAEFYVDLSSPLSADTRYLGTSQALPEVVKRGLLQMDEVHDLFQLYFDRVNPFFSILDPNYHTPNNLIHSSPFLFTVVCTVASRYYDAHPQLYPLLMSFARDAAGRALVDGSKSVDTCQAYLLLAVYPKPRKRWAEDRSWTLMGVAIRLALELGINQPLAQQHQPTQASLNQTRTWLNCFCVDASHATQYGKLPMVRLQDDYVARHSRDWWRSSEMNLDYDIHLCGYVDILLVMAKFRRIVDKEGDEEDVVERLVDIDRELYTKIGDWFHLYQTQSFSNDPICRYRGNTTRLIAAYSRLVVLAHAFRLELKNKGLRRGTYIVRESIIVAQDVLQIMIRDMYPVVHPTRMLRFSMEAHFVYVAYAAAFLLNLLRPKCKPLLEPNQEKEITRNVGRLIEILGSKEVALDGRHTPMLYSRFLSSLLAKYDHSVTVKSTANGSGASSYTQFAAGTGGGADRSYSPPSGEIVPQYNRERDPTPPHMYYWPDTSQVVEASGPGMEQQGQNYPSGTVYQQSGEADMDFSMTHFLQTVSAGHTNGTYGAQLHAGGSVPGEAMDDRWGMSGQGDDFFGASFANTGWPHAVSPSHSSQYGQPWTEMRP